MAIPSRAYHVPVLLDETLALLDPQPQEIILDATVGGAGHSARIAEAIQPGGILICLDRDEAAVQEATRRLATYANNCRIVVAHSDFASLDVALDARAETRGVTLHGAFFDLGVSSNQLETPRGFSFQRTVALDARMDATSGSTAAQFLAVASEKEIAHALTEYGGERYAGRIARTIEQRRRRGKPVSTTTELAEIVEASIPRAAWPPHTHPATRTFQALRILVNDELGQLSTGLEAAIRRLKTGGRIAVISYHSLEDRLVKQAFNNRAGRIPSPQGYSPAAFAANSAAAPTLRLLTRKPIVPTAAEIARNPRARSAKLRAAVRIAED